MLNINVRMGIIDDYFPDRKCLVGPCAKDRIIASASNTFRATKCLMASNYEDPVVQLIT